MIDPIADEVFADIKDLLDSEVKKMEAEEKAAKKAANMKFLKEWYGDSPSGSVLSDFKSGNYETIYAGKK